MSFFNNVCQVRPFSDEAPPSIRVGILGKGIQEIAWEHCAVRRAPAGNVNPGDGRGVADAGRSNHMATIYRRASA